MWRPFLPFTLLLHLLLLPLTHALTNLFDDGLKGPILGTYFGVPSINATFDYVVVGGGTAGLTIAARLAADPAVSVAVVEAGGFYETDNGNLTVIPGSAIFWTGSDPRNFQPLIDWGFSTSPQVGSGGRKLHYARGKTLGGSSARNYMLYQRGTTDSYQRWADEVDDQTYTFPSLLPFFQRSCDYTAPNLTLYTNATNPQNATAFSKNGGPLQVSFSNNFDPFGSWAEQALVKAGMPQINGFNTGKLIGTAYATLTIDPRNGHRSTSESSFLAYAIQNGTAPITYKNTLAQRILFNSTSNRTATGVLVTTAGTFGTPSVNFTLSARKEVIVSAGAFQSPQLLMVSGIGARGELEKFDIPVISDLPGVGKNMWDHPIFGIDHRVDVNTASAGLNNATLARAFAQKLITTGTGPLSVFGAGIYGWEKLPEPYRSQLSNSSLEALATFPADWPELEWLPVSAYNGDNVNKQTADPRDGHNYATLNNALITPISRGTVSLAGPEMTTPPIIDPAWLTDKTDIEIAIQGFKRIRQVWNIFVELGVADPVEAYPGSNVTTDAQILDAIHKSMTTVYHASATCKMGKKSDPLAVIDSSAKVYGVKGVRVVDASSFPFLPPGHPQSTIYALAEKIADEILKGIGSVYYGQSGYADTTLVAKSQKTSGAEDGWRGRIGGGGMFASLAAVVGSLWLM